MPLPSNILSGPPSFVNFSGEAPVRFPMASTFKVPLSLSLLKQVDAGTINLEEIVTLQLQDVRSGTGVLATHLLSTGAAKHLVHALLEMAMNDPDNTATDYLLERIGGPAVLQADMQELGLSHIKIARGCLEHL
eukprot:TRINITY_DN58084_c0_g1_i1.p1 TRINITY_DN58084_c0_g1~~TRINITY_DN58084_c0_g1_i1.p1  ORF type:complete len:134 (+),score=15.74 TRINITY_DN58084_c0_g1_i1:90-491(+)